MTWDEAVHLIQDSYASFSPEAGRIVSDFFERRWVDGPVRPDKHIGAYCMTRVPGVHPYVLMNYTGDRRSVLTLAHELGHGLHGVLAQDRGVFNSETPLTLAETASVFGEALTFRNLVARRAGSRSAASTCSSGASTTRSQPSFRQIAMNRFEDAVHTARRGEGELAADRVSELWIETQRALLGDSVDLDGYATWWSYVPHYVVSPGYVYAYAYGYLFSLAIFRRLGARGRPARRAVPGPAARGRVAAARAAGCDRRARPERPRALGGRARGRGRAARRRGGARWLVARSSRSAAAARRRDRS